MRRSQYRGPPPLPGDRVSCPGARWSCLSAWAVVGALLWAGPLPAETAFVTDRLLLGVHESKSLDAAVLRLLESGDAVEVLERDGELARVRTSRGREGWVDGRYLSAVAPAAALAPNGLEGLCNFVDAVGHQTGKTKVAEGFEKADLLLAERKGAVVHRCAPRG